MNKRVTAIKPMQQLMRKLGIVASSESGTTVVEMIVATFVLGVGIAGAAGMLVASSRTVSATEHRATATAIGVAEVEEMRSWPYATLGIDPTEPGYQPSVDGRITVSEATGNRVEPRGLVEVDGLEFDIDRHVSWAAIGRGVDRRDQAYKVITVVIRWSDTTGDHDLLFETGVFGVDDDG